MQTFKEYLAEGRPYINARGKGVTREEAKELLQKIKRALRPEDYQQHISEYQDDWDLSIRDYEYFTPRPGEEDDDWPDFTGEKELLKKLKPILKGLAWSFSPEEKSWITIYIKKKPLTKAQQRADKKKKIEPVVAAVLKSQLTDDSFWRKFYENLMPVLKKHKKKFITKAEFFDYAKSVNWYDDDAAQEAWDKAK